MITKSHVHTDRQSLTQTKCGVTLSFHSWNGASFTCHSNKSSESAVFSASLPAVPLRKMLEAREIPIRRAKPPKAAAAPPTSPRKKLSSSSAYAGRMMSLFPTPARPAVNSELSGEPTCIPTTPASAPQAFMPEKSLASRAASSSFASNPDNLSTWVPLAMASPRATTANGAAASFLKILNYFRCLVG